MGVIAVETRTTETVLYADPAVETSQEEVVKEAGQVWFPNSSFKTAQAIKDFNHGEQLPLLIFANWRGFSGGQSDMYKEVLKFGAQIVDALRDFRQPIFIYVVGELRGGAWVVVDPSINSEMMEMYCYENARGGVLEPQGIVEIKYRAPRIISTMERIDPTYETLKKSLSQNLSDADKAKVNKQIKDIEKKLYPIYEQAAVELADLHDRPQRMLAKGVIREIVTWQQSRSYFYWRLSRRLQELEIVKSVQKGTSYKYEEALNVVQSWFRQDNSNLDDRTFVQWVTESHVSISDRIARLNHLAVRDQITSLAKSSPSAFMEALAQVMQTLSIQDKQELLERVARR
jgi:acetyl-CoA carboxylase/biotin carboxylase 1